MTELFAFAAASDAEVLEFTLVSFFYAPLPFTASFFGTTFRGLVTYWLSLWSLVAMSVSICGASMLTPVWDPQKIHAGSA
jgi:hypothetical protein